MHHTPERQAQSTPGGMIEGSRWGDRISEERKVELELLLREWQIEARRGNRRGPFDGMRLTGADVFWLATLALEGFEGDVAEAEEKLRALRMRDGAPPSLTLSPVHLEAAVLSGAHLAGAVLPGARLDGADLAGAHLEAAQLAGAHLEGAVLERAHLWQADLADAHMVGADLRHAHLEQAVLVGAHLEKAQLVSAHLEGAILIGARLREADLGFASLDVWTVINDVTRTDSLLAGALVADMRWGDANLAVINWKQVPVLGDERAAWAWKPEGQTGTAGKKLSRRASTRLTRPHRIELFRSAVRANQQVAALLREQDLHAEADHFTYRAWVLQRRVYRLRQQRARWLFSGLLDLISGYGYSPGRSAIVYLVAALGLGGLYLLSTHVALPHLSWEQAMSLSLGSLASGTFPQLSSFDQPLAVLAAIVALTGVVIEIDLIATFLQRLFEG